MQQFLCDQLTSLIILTGLKDEEIAVQAIKMAVEDYLFKQESDHFNLIRSLRYALERTALKMQLKEAKQGLEKRVQERTLELEKN